MKLELIAHPHSKRPRVEKDLLGGWHVYVSQPPLAGRANAAIIAALAGHFKISKAQVKLLRGGRSKLKLFEIN